MNALVVFPIIVPLVTAAASLLFWRRGRVQRSMAVVGVFVMLGVSVALLRNVSLNGIQVMQVGAWPAPYGITLAVDLFSAIMLVMSGIIGAGIVVYSSAGIDARRASYGYYPLLNIMLVGVNGAFVTGDLFNLYVWFEVMLISSFVLLALGGERGQVEGAVKYVALNLMASAFFLAGVGLLYGLAGTLNMADLAQRLRTPGQPGSVVVVSMIFLVAFGIKAAMFPLFFWLPASYHTPPVTVAALFAGLLTKVGVYALIRVFTLIFVQDVAYTHGLILLLAGLTMVTGVLGAVAQTDFRRLLSFHIVSQIGYLLMGLGLFSALGLAASIFFMVHIIIAKSALFMVSGICYAIKGTYDLKKLGDLYKLRPGLAVLFLLPALSLAGFPPLSGFFAKLLLVQAGLTAYRYTIVIVALAVSLLTLFSMMKIWGEAFWKRAPAEHREVEAEIPATPGAAAALWVPTGMLSLLTLAAGVMAGPIFELSRIAAEQLMDPAQYIGAVLGARR